MVNYCCVYGCTRNNRTNNNLNFFSLPKERHRLQKWLEAIGRAELLDLKKLNHRVCSRHFAPADIKNKHLCADAIPTLYLPSNGGGNEDTKGIYVHDHIVCDSCRKPIFGFRYKCVTCEDYDLCAKCEMLEAHPQHFFVRVPKPINFMEGDNIVKKLQGVFRKEYQQDNSSDDDVPITKYARNHDTGLEVPENIKELIRNEINRVVHMKPIDKCKEETKRKMDAKKKGTIKKKKVELPVVKAVDNTLDAMAPMAPEVAFADVNDIKENQMLDVKDEIPNSLTPLGGGEQESSASVLHNIKLNDDLSEFLIGVKYP
ncbi:uncharacterized protein LOC113497886 [Trichoplusia ni]|uniref:Uncharacterized protein LOC113497886 n=1 Tax=Trichoplusia ni TaxID=7111 RepID=A0A7E5VZD4_TRINI|nr:uncharacterized protein LOC113497886 [Trichoplusia ni]